MFVPENSLQGGGHGSEVHLHLILAYSNSRNEGKTAVECKVLAGSGIKTAIQSFNESNVPKCY